VTGAVKQKGNLLEIDVTNLWRNRLIGDAALPVAQRLTKTNVKSKPGDALLTSGLLGPVGLRTLTFDPAVVGGGATK